MPFKDKAKELEYRRIRYYQNHEHILLRMRKWREKNKERLNAKTRERRQANSEQHNLTNKEWRDSHKEHIKIHGKEYRYKLCREYVNKIKQLFPTLTCTICGKQDNQSILGVSFHEIHGHRHEYHSIFKFRYIIAHYQDFVPICKAHHVKIHNLMRKDYAWNEIVDLLESQLLKPKA